MDNWTHSLFKVQKGHSLSLCFYFRKMHKKNARIKFKKLAAFSYYMLIYISEIWVDIPSTCFKIIVDSFKFIQQKTSDRDGTKSISMFEFSVDNTE